MHFSVIRPTVSFTNLKNQKKKKSRRKWCLAEWKGVGGTNAKKADTLRPYETWGWRVTRIVQLQCPCVALATGARSQYPRGRKRPTVPFVQNTTPAARYTTVRSIPASLQCSIYTTCLFRNSSWQETRSFQLIFNCFFFCSIMSFNLQYLNLTSSMAW